MSVTAEVTEVVELILEHAPRPAESLGVIALGIKHAERIDAALRQALTAATGSPPSLGRSPRGVAAVAAAGRPGRGRTRVVLRRSIPERPEPFFVKNLERVQGDERDAIILSIGYGKHPDGRMRYQWGPLLRDGGERRRTSPPPGRSTT